MSFSPKEILKFVEENDVKFIRLTFCDMFGNLKNVAIMPNELPRAFEYGIPFDAVVGLIVPAILPFNIIKAVVISILTGLVYKSISNLITPAKNQVVGR